ncbi:uncharacterized protein LOC129918535 [Episyrphus balteatus]|uniref:uncharacterized protein LOC129918535 n=1 Tax=Episyrphus balteatus TaxID=286459 RepID=UPI002486B3CF|nr:uncharacterized protein LOC129918535 [Episyrphus balteatus]XP_055855110.1 uncharacterized protein LOC129918535 [Episyrphus balteatus]XP_055855111.1 uncharacterized protein LOC129918535 [Episyrphus balteatus]XP_055855112.1 uncharacterized protein LOC129918535 [Episyrphus balteatus]
MTEEQQHHQETSASPQSQRKSPPKDRKNINDLRNQDYVSRLLAATPPYLYSAPVGPNNFFFSDMLKSLVQARNNENARNLQMQQAAVMARRPRKRSWSQHRPYYEQLRERKGLDEKIQIPEKPLELTNKQFLPMSAVKYHKTDTATKELICSKELNECGSREGQTILQDSPAAASLPPQDLVLPPPPPVWYPPIYPPYGIDPLHFFIDLRVSGHIYDRKKGNVSPLANAENNSLATDSEAPGKYRHGSAFSVPVPRSESKGSAAINLSSSSSSASETSNKLDNYAKYYDLGETKENLPSPKSSSNYMLQNLPRLYGQFASATKALNDENSYENDKSDQDCEDSIDEHSCGNYRDNSSHIDVEMIESTKFQNEGITSACASPEESKENDLID